MDARMQTCFMGWQIKFQVIFCGNSKQEVKQVRYVDAIITHAFAFASIAKCYAVRQSVTDAVAERRAPAG